MTKILNRLYLPPGKVLFREGDEAGKAYYIEKGTVEVYRTDSNHKDQRIAIVGAGEIVGELAFFGHPKTRTASVRAKEDCTVIGLSRPEVEAFIETMEKPARALYKLLLQRLQHTNDLMVDHFTSLKHLNEAGRITIENLRKDIHDGPLLVEFDQTIVPHFNTMIALLREFEKKKNQVDPD